MVPANFLPCKFNRCTRPLLLQITRDQEHIGTGGIPFGQFQPDVRVVFKVNAADKSHNACVSASVVGDKVGDTVGLADGEAVGVEVG